MKLTVGIDIGGTNSHFGLVSPEGRIINQSQISTKEYPRPENLVSRITNEIKILTEGYELTSAGIGAPNGNFYTGNIEFAPNLNWEGVIPLAQMFREKLGLPTVLTNDANAAAIGEQLFGKAKNMKNFILITLGTGLGSGYVVDGKILYGHDGFAGELGHTIIIPDGRQCGCGRKGCLETYASASGLSRTYKELSGEEVNALDIYERALNKDTNALVAFDQTAQILGLGLANAVAISSPEAIFLYGGLINSGDLLLRATRAYMEQNMLNLFKNKVRLELSDLGENAAILGAAALAMKSV